MKLDLLPDGSWESFQQQLRAQIPEWPVGAEGIRVYKGISHGLYEVLVSLAQLYPHKRKIMVVEGTSPYLNPQLKYFSREGYEILRIHPDQLNTPEAQEKLTSDCLFLLLSEDQAITGELYDFTQLEAIATKNRIFTVRLSHHTWRLKERHPLTKFSLQLCSVSSGLALLFHGARYKIAPILTNQMHWTQAELGAMTIEIRRRLVEAKAEVQQFEKALPSGARPFFKNLESRIYDRSVVVLENVSAAALTEELIGELGLSLSEPPGDSLIDTPNQCRWGEIDWQDWWRYNTPTENEFRGLLVIDQEIIQKSGFLDLFSKCLARIESLQSFRS